LFCVKRSSSTSRVRAARSAHSNRRTAAATATGALLTTILVECRSLCPRHPGCSPAFRGRRRRRSICQPPGTVPGPRHHGAHLRPGLESIAYTVERLSAGADDDGEEPSIVIFTICGTTMDPFVDIPMVFRTAKVSRPQASLSPGIVEGPREAGGLRPIPHDFGVHEARGYTNVLWHEECFWC
jgi:hypothetical protein